MEAPPRLSQTQAPGGVFLVFVFFIQGEWTPDTKRNQQKERDQTKPQRF